MYTKQFEIRWRDLDANKHLGNSSYIDFMSHTRMSFFSDMGIGLEVMEGHQLGPIVFYEHIYYFQEIRLGNPITVSLEVTGISEDGRFIKIEHNFYDIKKKNLAFCEMLFSWIDLKSRKLGILNNELLELIHNFPKAKSFKILTREDTRKNNKIPRDLY